MSYQEDFKNAGFPIGGKTIGLAVAGVLALTLAFTAAVQTEENERKAIMTWGEYSRTTEPGLDFKVPFMQSERTYIVEPQAIDVLSPKTATADNQNLENVQVKAQIMIDKNRIEFLHKTAPGYKALLQDWLLKAQKGALGAVNTINLTEQRAQVEEDMRSRLQTLIDTGVKDDSGEPVALPIAVTSVTLETFNWDTTFETSIQANMQKKNEVERAESEKRQAEIKAEEAKVRAEGEANAAREAADGQRDAAKSRADGEAYAISVTSEAEAAKITQIGAAEAGAFEAKVRAFGDPDAFVDFTKAQQWNGQLPQTVVGDTGSGTIFLDTRGDADQKTAATVNQPRP